MYVFLLTESVHRVPPILVNATALRALHVENNSVSYKLHNGYSTLKGVRKINSNKKARHACPSSRIISTLTGRVFVKLCICDFCENW